MSTSAAPRATTTRAARLRERSAERRAQGKADLKRQILDAARTLFGTKGYEGFSLRQVAEEIGYSPTAIYLHFKDKDTLLLTVALEGFRTFGTALQAAYTGHTGAYARLEAIGAAYLRFGFTHPLEYRLMFMQRPEFLEHQPPEGYAGIEDSFGVLLRTIREGVASGELGVVNAEEFAAMLWALVHGMVSLSLATGSFPVANAERLLLEHLGSLRRGWKGG